MTFSSQNFLLYLLPVFLISYFFSKKITIQNNVFVVFSLIFYSASKIGFLFLLMASIGANFALALAIDKADDYRRYRLLAYGITGNLLLLFGFKYTGFVLENINFLFNFSGIKIAIPVPEVSLPLGISFYTFHAISYIVDITKRKVRANSDFSEFLLYMSMFPQLVAGPIVRYSTISHQLRKRRVTLGRFSAGMRLFVIGLAWKLLIADEVAPVADAVFDQSITPSFTEAWLGVYAYAMQIYFDFGGYSTMGVGLGIMVGFRLPRNFRLPYSALSITDFWRRWHMSLSAWLRDYVYIPLGGNRGSAVQTYINLSLVFILCGLWHGASWTFVIWGAYHGLFLIIERAGLGRILKKLPHEIAHLYTVFVAFLGWVWFRATDFSAAWRMFRGLFGFNELGGFSIPTHVVLSPVAFLALGVAALIGLWKWPRFNRLRLAIPSSVAVLADTTAFVLLFMLCIITAAASNYSPFLYYRF